MSPDDNATCSQLRHQVQPKPVETIPSEHLEIHEYLITWGRWISTRKQQGHCRSMEHHYRSPQCWNENYPKPEINEAQAALIESVMRIVPKTSRKLLKLRYALRAEPTFIVQRLRLRDYPGASYTARQIVLNLTRHKLAPTMHGSFHNLRLSGLTEISP